MKAIQFIVFFALLFVNPASYGTTSLTPITDPDFGSVFSGLSGRQFILGTNGSIGGSNASDYVSGASAGIISVADDAAVATLQIEAVNIVTTGGVNVSRVLCAYAGGSETRCDNGGYQVNSATSANLLIGLDITTTQTHTGHHNSTVTFDIEVTYL